MSNSNLFLYLGKPIKNEYGKVIGKVASFALTPNGTFDSVFVEFGDGQFSKQSLEYLKFEGTDVTLISKIRSKANSLCDQIPLIWRKDQAIKDLNGKGKISPDLFQELHNSFESVLAQLKKDAKVLDEEASVELARVEEEIKSLSYAVVNVELEHEIGQIDEETYNNASAILQENLKRAQTEKTDYELTKSRIAGVLLGDPTTTQNIVKPNTVLAEPIQNVQNAADLPEPPVVVYVKEIGKTGI